MGPSEFDLIERFFSQRTIHRGDVPLGIGDDAAILTVPKGMELVAAVDTLVADVHFPAGAHPSDVGYKALAVNLSDLAAMGAEPAWATLALTMQRGDEEWVKAFGDGFFSLADQYKVQLVGGDTTRGPLSVTVQMLGLLPPEQALCRHGAQVGDLIYVTGTVGDAGLGLLIQQNQLAAPQSIRHHFLERLHRPKPRLKEGQALRGLATAAIDISDGLAADLGHVLHASGVGATLSMHRIPLSEAFTGMASEVDRMASQQDSLWPPHLITALSAGDDYELCFTIPPDRRTVFEALVRGFDCDVTLVGEIDMETGLRGKTSQGDVVAVTTSGYQHF